MFLVLKVAAIALVSLLGNALLNQLPAFRDFSGKTGLIVRLILYLTFITIAHELIGDKTASETVVMLCRYGIVAAGVAIAYEGVSLWGEVRRQPADQGAGPDEEALLLRLLADVKSRIHERLEYAVGEKALINVAMQPQGKAVGRQTQSELAQPKWNRWLKFLKGGQDDIDIGENVLAAYTHPDVNRKLLILGEPGSGKTTTLLKLADLLAAQAGETAPVPYIFELSAWRDDKQEIKDWLVDQLTFDCGIDPKVGYQWIKHNRLVPLLDGLDELGLERQKKCVPKINDFAKLPSQQVVVCCRSEEYAEGAVVLDELRGALCLGQTHLNFNQREP